MDDQTPETGARLAFGTPLVEEVLSSPPATLAEANAQIRTLAEGLRRSEEELRDFVYNVAHDMRQPLRAIRTFAQFLLEDIGDELDGEPRDYLRRLQVNADRSSEQLLGLLELSRIGRWTRPWEAVDLQQVATLVTATFAGRLEEAGVQARVAADLPVVPGERQRLVQLLEILVENALLYRRGTGGFVSIESRPADEADECEKSEILVCDDGIGIEEQHREDVFSVFRRLHPTEFSGIGMGLTLARRIVEIHRGRIWLTSRPDGGTVVHVRFSVLDPDV